MRPGFHSRSRRPKGRVGDSCLCMADGSRSFPHVCGSVGAIERVAAGAGIGCCQRWSEFSKFPDAPHIATSVLGNLKGERASCSNVQHSLLQRFLKLRAPPLQLHASHQLPVPTRQGHNGLPVLRQALHEAIASGAPTRSIRTDATTKRWRSARSCERSWASARGKMRRAFSRRLFGMAKALTILSR